MTRRWPVLELLATMWGASRALSVFVGLLTAAQGLLPVAFVWASGALVGEVPAAVRDGFESPSGRRFISLLVTAAALFVVQQVLAPIADTVSRMLARRVDRLLRSDTMNAMSSPPGIAHLEDPALQDVALVARGAAQNDMTPGLAVMGLAGVVGTILTGLLSAWIVVSWKWWVGVGLVVVWGLVRAFFRRDLLKIAEMMMGQAVSLRRSKYYRDISMQAGVGKELRVFGLRPLFVERFAAHWAVAMQEVWARRRRSLVPILVSGAVLAVVQAASLVVLGRDFLGGGIDLAQFSILLGATLQVGSLGSVGNHDFFLSNGLPVLSKLRAGAVRIAEHPSSISLGGDAVSPSMPATSLRFEGVGFSYPGNPMPIYEGIDLEIPVGRSLAIVGPNGAGKTTLVKLLARFYDPTAGRVLVDGVDLRSLDPSAWQRRIAAIFQDFVQYPLSVRDNLSLTPGVSDEVLVRAADRAGALDIIEALPENWETTLGRQFAGGAELSGGQWQRIALARALVAVEHGASVLVLDEPTANLDVRAEAALFDRFLDLTEGLTTILISHRFSTVRRADLIAVLDGGRVTEQGTHDELLALGGTYARMFTLQASRFTDEVTT